ncbi:HTH-type transcriptional regulatory protein gabR [Slackia heliotrinireducens]|nr:PLP-dependent aminotransferase family protein [Slackia heliotrinireducens]VEG98746.1 HTH-type transcriptional regulatory protein gabR [Slackia heliotrinireducens]
MAKGRPCLMMVSIDKSDAAPLYQQIYRQIAVAIEQGVITAGQKLPSLRGLAQELGVGRITVEKAYLQLAVEGYVTASERSGYVVNRLDTDYLQLPQPDNFTAVAEVVASCSGRGFAGEVTAGRAARYDFSYFDLQPGSFPKRDWARALTDALYSVSDMRMTGYPIDAQPTQLQVQIAAHLARTRGVRCAPEQVVVFPGTANALEGVLQLLPNAPRVFGMEEPGYDLALSVAQRQGLDVVPLATDGGAQAYLQAVEEHAPDVVFATPSHQFPTGFLMDLSTRIDLLRLSEALDFYVIEDDSCNEYRYGTGPVPSLQSLDAGNRVVYMGNFSKTFTPALRIAFAVLPPELLARLYRDGGLLIPSVNTHIQDALAMFMADGHLDRHVRRMVASNRERHDILLECLRRDLGDFARISGVNSGMHFYVELDTRMPQRELIERAARRDVRVYGTERFWFSRSAPSNALLIGFSSIRAEDIPTGVGELKRAWL